MMKGFFRGLRCIFDTDNEKEPEIQIGAPTDVKHVAHIGCDGPSTPAPSWMNEYQGGSEQSGEKGGTSGSPSHAHKTRQNRRSTHGNESSANHRPRKNKSSASESAASESSHTRRIKNSLLGSESAAQETNVKKTRKKKDGTTRSSKTKDKDPSDATFSDSGCSDGVCHKPQD